MPDPVLTRRAPNRALLARQMLLEREPTAVLDALERLVGIQAQAPYAPYVGLWTRLEGFAKEDLVALLEQRRAVRIVLMRGTIHLVTAADCLYLRPLVQSVIERGMNGAYGPRLAGSRQRRADRDGPRAADRAARGIRAPASAAARSFRDESGAGLFDLPDAPRPDPDTEAPVRFVPEYDNLFVSHADRGRVIAPAHREPLFTKGGFLVGGFLAGAWKRDRTTLHVDPFVRLSRADRAAVEEEGLRLLEFTAGSPGGAVRFGSVAA